MRLRVNGRTMAFSRLMRCLVAAAVVFGGISLSEGQTVTAIAKPTPVVAELPGDLNRRVEELLERRRAIFADFKEQGRKAEAEIAELLPAVNVLADPQVRAELAPRLVPAIRWLAQVQSLRHDFGGRRNITMLASATASPVEGLTFVENSQWNAARLLALGDDAGARQIATYAGFDPVVMHDIAGIVTADGASVGTRIAALGEKLRANPFDESAGDEAILVLKRGLGTEADRQSLLAALQAIAPECSPHVSSFVRVTAAGDKFSRVEKLVGTTDFKVRGSLVDGTPFDGDALLGKVVIVDFWATWCGPCVAELPRLVGLFDKHEKDGLAIVGISNDFDREALTGFLANRPEIRWPQLFDAKSAANNETHELTRGSGIQGIPALFVIDRQGVLRSVKARSELESIVTELLREPAAK